MQNYLTEMLGNIKINLASGPYIPKRSQVIKNKRRRAHLLRTKRK